MIKILRNQKPVKHKKKGWRRTLLTALLVLFILTVGVGFSVTGYLYFKYSKGLPDVRLLKEYQPNTITRVYSDVDELIAEFYVEKRILVSLDQIPLKLKQATLAVEDSNFYYHFGIDPKAIFRAFITNIKAGRVVEGGSTITQQLSKTLFLSFEKSLERKIKEAILAIRMELVFSKDDILEMYLNQIYYGHGSYGVEGAARTYFGKNVQDLTTSECALLAALPKAPNNYSPYRAMKKALNRRDHVLRRMARMGFIDAEEKATALKEELQLGGVTDKLNKAPYFIEYIRQFIQKKYGSNKLYRDGLQIFTTLNYKNQYAAQEAIRAGLRDADKRFGYRGSLGRVNLDQDIEDLDHLLGELNERNEDETLLQAGDTVKGVVTQVSTREAEIYLGIGEGSISLKSMDWARKPDVKRDSRYSRIKSVHEALSPGDIILAKLIQLLPGAEQKWELALEQEPEVQAALMSLDPSNGNIKAMVGGYDFKKSQFNRAIQAVRQPGSAFKPIIYAASLQDGFTPASIIIDSPVIFREKEDTFDKWKPVNFEKRFYGPTSIRTALTHSRNVVTIKLLQSIGVGKAIGLARALGIKSHLENNLSIALGSSGVTLFELVSAYSVFVNNGIHIDPIPVRYIKNRKDEVIFTAEPVATQAISPGLAYLITNLLESVVQEGTGSKVKGLNRPVAAKTGTTNNYIDAWFLGYTPELVTGVWVGKDQDETMGINETGARAAIPIWFQYMKEALEGLPVKNFNVPEDVAFVKIDPQSGAIAEFDDAEAKFEVFLKNNLPEKAVLIDNPIGGSTF